MASTRPGLGRGERAADFVLPLLDGASTRFYSRAGGAPTLLAFCASGELQSLVKLNRELAEAAALFAVVRGELEAGAEAAFPIFADGESKVRQAYRLAAGDAATLFVLDANLRVLQSMALEGIETAEVRAVLDASISAAEPRIVAAQAPLLLVSNALEAEICDHLLDVWERGNEETGVEESSAGQRRDAIDRGAKRRRDHVVQDQGLVQVLVQTIGRRVLPEVYKAFAYRATHFEGFKIVCYDAADSGFFDAHRDNLSPSTAHRHFALTLNLNGDYEGGYLRFPEYGADLYRPAPGGAAVFSCSHLHEVTQVEAGRRFALLSFLYAQDSARARPPT